MILSIMADYMVENYASDTSINVTLLKRYGYIPTITEDTHTLTEELLARYECPYPIMQDASVGELRQELLAMREKVNPKYVASYENADPNYEHSSKLDITKIADYLYEMSYDNIDWDSAKIIGEKKFRAGACSGVRNGNFFGRNYDWYYDNACTFVIKVSGNEERFASVGIASASHLTKDFVESGKNSEEYTFLPFMTLDGINENGVTCSINVVPVGDYPLTTGTNPGAEDMCALAIVRYILDNATSADHAIELIKSKNIYAANTPAMVEEFHWLIADPNKTYIVEIIDNKISVIDKFVDDKPIMTNFYLTGWDGTKETHTPHAMGIERYDILSAGYDSMTSVESTADLMHSVNYSNAYNFDSDPVWYSEVYADYGAKYGDITVNSTPEQIQPILDVMAEMFANRSRELPVTWHTVHTSVYDIENLTLRVNVQENDTYYDYSLDKASDTPAKSQQPNDEIWYTTTTHKSFNEQIPFSPNILDFNANLISDTYDNTSNKGIMKFDRDLTIWDCNAWEWDNVYYVDTISLPASIKEIGSYGYFHRCPISSITFHSETPLTLGGSSIIDKIDAIYDDLKIYVPASAVTAYKTAWPEFADRITAISK